MVRSLDDKDQDQSKPELEVCPEKQLHRNEGFRHIWRMGCGECDYDIALIRG